MHKVLLIGLGYHARRIHVPVINAMPNVELVCVVDVLKEKQLISKYLNDQNISTIERYLTDSERLDDLSWRAILTGLVKELGIDSVLIATEPLSHFRYVMWALEVGLNILLDKPISTAEQIANSPKIARENLQEYRSIKRKYLLALRKNNVVFTVLAQRRFHPMFDIARNAIEEVYEATNCPITLQNSLHCDGQWRFPDEIIEQDYHPYNSGYGKLSHSGYHTVDVMAEFTAITHKADKSIDNIEVFAQSSRPADFLSQLSLDDHRKLFQAGDVSCKYGNEYKSLMRSFGEVDVTVSIAFRQGEQTLTLGTLNLAHTGYGQRNWPNATGRDLYKGNGRVRQEQYTIEQGPFQSILISSFQSKEISDSYDSGFGIGGESHLEVVVFRNNKLFPDWLPVRVYNVKDVMSFDTEGYARGHNEESRKRCIYNFFEYIDNGVIPGKQKSNFLDHELSAIIFSSIYLSLANKQSGKGSGIVKAKIMEKTDV
jgi:predicted dehydrogenase